MSKPIIVLLALMILAASLLLPSASLAQSEYTLGPDDVIEITVRNHDDLNKTLTILPNGKITYVGVGELTAAGRTPRDVAAVIEAELTKTYNNLAVTVAVKEIHSRRVKVIGGVKSPGAYDLRANWRVFDVLAAAGGLALKPGRITARLIRGGTRSIPISLE